MRTFTLFVMTLISAVTSLAQDLNSFSGHVLADEGAWCWFADPRALHYENKSGTINATYLGYIDHHGSIKATQIDWKTKTTTEVLVRSWFQPDDHDNPAFLVLPDERIMLIYSRHTDEPCFYYRISKRPGDITALGEEKRLDTPNNTTYPNPYILSNDPDHIYMCWRGTGWHPTVAQMSMPDKNDNIQFTWGPYQMVQSTGSRPYAKYISDGKSKIYLTYTTGHPDNEYPNWIYCNVFDINDKCLYDVKGNKLSTVQNGTFKVQKTAAYKANYPYTVVDATDGKRDWTWNMAFDTKGNPLIGMTKISADKQDHQYYYAHWTGAKWNVSFIANGGKYFHHSANTENCYSSGMAIDRDQPNVVYCGVPVGSVHEIWKYTLDDNDKVVSQEAVTQNSVKTNARPFVIEGTQHAKDGANALRLAWMNGDYYYWIVNTTYPKGYPTSIMTDTPMPHNYTSTSGQTLEVDMQISSGAYKGDVLTCGDITYGVNDQQYAYVRVGGKTYTSQNVLGTADSWATENNATTGGKWFTKTPLGRFNLTLTVSKGILTVYVNGIIDMKIDCEATLGKAVAADNATIYAQHLTSECLTQSQIKRNITMAEIEAINVPTRINTDIVLPTTTASGKSITWTTSNPDVLSASGIVNLPASPTQVTLNARVDNLNLIKLYLVTVQPREIERNIRASFLFDDDEKGITLMGGATLTDGKLNLTANTTSGVSTNGYALVDKGLLKGLRSYTILLTATPKTLIKAPRLYDFGSGSGNSMFLRASALSAGVKYNGGTTMMVNANNQLAANNEYKLAVTFDAATHTTRIYVDGQLQGQSTSIVNEPYMLYDNAVDERNYIGRTQWWDSSYAADNADFTGTIDDFYIYDIALTAQEIAKAQGLEVEQKEYATNFVNGDFEGQYSVMTGSGVSADRAIYLPQGWTLNYEPRDPNDITALKAGDLYYSNFFADKAQNSEGGANTLWIRQRWGASVIDYHQDVMLEAGKYTLTAQLYSSDNSANNTASVYVDKMVRNASSVNAWQTVTIPFEADGKTPVSIGAKAMHNANEFICAFDNFSLTKHVETAIAPIRYDASAPVYDLFGRVRTSTSPRGIGIVAGKKIIVK